ncbi:MAG: prephenate dehydrogenase [Phycisphaerae bacterium]
MTPWNQVTIIGTGLIGGSLGLAMKRAGLARKVVGVGHRQTTLDRAVACGAADETALEAAEGVRGSDLVVLATAVGLFEPLLRRAARDLADGAVVIDVGSTKAEVVRIAETVVPEGRAFVGCHPIAGSEKRGIDYADADLFGGAVCVVTPTDRTPADALARVTDTWEALGMRVVRLSAAEHDRLLAEVSHLPHLAAAALVQAVGPEAERLVGSGWTDSTRIAGGDPGLWRDILLTNAAGVGRALEQFREALKELEDALARGDGERIEHLLADAKARRDRIVGEA